ncbi:glycosyltransferase family 39 protein [Archangium primigenium]|uniref:glycosyltransferase family 39 protein n=1 Tax=[Archangium] primigenium TaxID=2792470 RepID=UPI00195B9D12|nr:glycosyltransferase family 39 protein [Archangium primigenium]MBM7114975.1 glycosyltransferase family 39 protein [Archangium primigenium]
MTWSEESSGVWTRRVVGLSGVLALLRLVYAARVELAPQEAYYWQYARHLDWSYFDHPPMCAWWIGLSVKLLGPSELGVRVPAVVSATLLTWLLYSLGRRLYSPAVGALAALAANATVLLGLGAVVMTPDVPLVLFWTAALRVLCELVLPDGEGAGRGGWRWYVLGALCGLAMLSKYTAALLPPQILLTALLSPRGRASLRSPHPYLALLVALAVFAPVFIWNAQHDWASFAFQTRGRARTVHGFQPHLLGRYLGLQAVAVGPLLYLSLLLSAGLLVGPALRGDPRARLLGLASLPGLLVFSAVSPLHWVKMNWVAPAYIGVFVATAARWHARWHTRGQGLYPGLALGTGALLVLGMYLMPLWPAIPFKEKDNLVSGWRQLAEHVQDWRQRVARPGSPPLVVGWGYKTASELAFYLPDRPETQSDPALGGTGLAYDFWWDRVGPHADALVVVDDRQPMRDEATRLAAHCGEVRALPPVTVRRGERPVTTYRLWHCLDWRREARAATAPGQSG